MFKRASLLVFAFALFAASASAQQDPLMGTWKLSLAKSKYSPGQPPREQTYTYEPSGANGVKFTSHTINAQGGTGHVEYTAQYDGREYPVAGDPNRDTTSLKRIDANTTEGTSKKGGKVTSTFRRVVSKDGKTLTVTSQGTNTQGQQTNNVAVYDKQ